MTDRSLWSISAAVMAALALGACKPAPAPGGPGGPGTPGGTSGPGTPPPPPPDPTEAFLKNPVRAESYAAMERLFPDDYVRIRAELDGMLKGGRSEADVQKRAYQLFREFSRAHIEQTASAPTANLVALAQRQRDLMSVLAQENVEACAQISRIKFDSDAGLSANSLMAMSRVNAAQLEATRAGMTTPNPREDALNEALGQAFSDAVKRQGLREEAMQAVFADEAENPPAALICEGGLGISKAIADMPAEEQAVMQAIALAMVLKGDKPASGQAGAQ